VNLTAIRMKLCLILLFSAMVLVQSKVNPFKKYAQKKTAKKDAGHVDQAALLNTNLRCHGTDSSCCNDDNPCMMGDGDCDSHDDCARDLVCGDNNCGHMFADPGDDCCEAPKVQFPTAMCHLGKWVDGDGYGDGEKWIGYIKTPQQCYYACLARRKSQKNVNGCTFVKGSDGGCYAEYSMEKVERTSSKMAEYQTCYLPHIDASSLRCQGSDDGCCTERNPCGLGDGDCDNDDQCAPGLYCANDNCAWGKNDDCCMERHVGDEEKAKEEEKLALEDPKINKVFEEDIITVEY